MLDANCYQSHQNCEEPIRKDTKGSRRKHSRGHSRRRIEWSRHDQLLHVPPGEVRSLQAREAQKELEGLLEELGIGTEMLLEEVALLGHSVAAEGDFALRHERLDDFVWAVFHPEGRVSVNHEAKYEQRRMMRGGRPISLLPRRSTHPTLSSDREGLDAM